MGWMPVYAENTLSSSFDQSEVTSASSISGEAVEPGAILRAGRASDAAVPGRQGYSESNPTRPELLIASVEHQTVGIEAADSAFSAGSAGVTGGAGTSREHVQVTASSGEASLDMIWLALSVLLGFGVVARRRRPMLSTRLGE